MSTGLDAPEMIREPRNKNDKQVIENAEMMRRFLDKDTSFIAPGGETMTVLRDSATIQEKREGRNQPSKKAKLKPKA
jgi:hypothetical protein